MTLSTLVVLGATATIVILKLALLAFIVILAAKTITSNYKPPKGNIVIPRSLLHVAAKKR